MKISEMVVGQEFAVRSVLLAHEVGRRLADMGFTEGARGKVVRRSMFRGPLQIRIRDYDVLIRRCEAAAIEAEPVGDILSAPGSAGGAGRGRRRQGRRMVRGLGLARRREWGQGSLDPHSGGAR